jgi:hypothetical protein
MCIIYDGEEEIYSAAMLGLLLFTARNLKKESGVTYDSTMFIQSYVEICQMIKKLLERQARGIS